MESIEKIKVLLERFYKGETTLREEQLLEDFFRKRQVPEEMLADKELFLSMEANPEDIEIPDDLNAKILHAIDVAERKEIKTRRIGIFSLSGLAAGLLVLITVYLFFLKEKPGEILSRSTPKDTYDDPMEAYEEVKKTLAYVSTKFNQGTGELKYVKEVNRSVGTLQPLTFISKGNKEIRLLQQLEKANDINKQKVEESKQ